MRQHRVYLVILVPTLWLADRTEGPRQHYNDIKQSSTPAAADVTSTTTMKYWEFKQSHILSELVALYTVYVHLKLAIIRTERCKIVTMIRTNEKNQLRNIYPQNKQTNKQTSKQNNTKQQQPKQTNNNNNNHKKHPHHHHQQQNPITHTKNKNKQTSKQTKYLQSSFKNQWRHDGAQLYILVQVIWMTANMYSALKAMKAHPLQTKIKASNKKSNKKTIKQIGTTTTATTTTKHTSNTHTEKKKKKERERETEIYILFFQTAFNFHIHLTQ